MAKTKTSFVCQSCGAILLRWAGQCPECGDWNTVAEETVIPPGGHVRESHRSSEGAQPLPLTTEGVTPTVRMSAGVKECDRVLGGGIVPGSLTLVGGDPGIGKSTLMLQVSSCVAGKGARVLYVSGEESFEQTRLRADRLGAISDDLYLLAETNLESIKKHIASGAYALVVVDSIQSMYTANLPAVPGSVSQVRDCATELLRLAKDKDLPLFLVGHVTKEGAIAGPRMLEHLVDTVLYFEGEGKQTLRILRAVKNRFGSTNEIGVFEMTETGLREVPNPSALFLDERPTGVSGSVVIPSIEGTRPLLVEVQALVGEPGYGSPRRTVTGVNPNRVSLLLAVLEKRGGLVFGDRDVFVNVAGGVRLEEPAADMAVALALVSSHRESPVPAGLAAFGEVGLAGEIRAVDRARQRVSEAATFGFTHCIVPRNCMNDLADQPLETIPVSGIRQTIDYVLERS
ncbi:MAG: DNA repair protein RadA [Candidatus Hydrogenedentota bacterium]